MYENGVYDSTDDEMRLLDDVQSRRKMYRIRWSPLTTAKIINSTKSMNYNTLQIERDEQSSEPIENLVEIN